MGEKWGEKKKKKTLECAADRDGKWGKMIMLNETTWEYRCVFRYFLYCILSISVLKYILAYNMKCRLVKELSSQYC